MTTYKSQYFVIVQALASDLFSWQSNATVTSMIYFLFSFSINMSGLRPLGKIEVIEKSICNCSSVFVTIAYILLCISVTRILMNI